jgi:hypothetical protein
MGAQSGLVPSEIRNARLNRSYYGAPVNAVLYFVSENHQYVAVPNEEHYSDKTANLAIGSSITIFTGAGLGFQLNLLFIRVAASTQVQLLLGAVVLMYDLLITNNLNTYNFMPQGLIMPTDGDALTLKNVAGAATDFYVNAYWCRY